MSEKFTYIIKEARQNAKNASITENLVFKIRKQNLCTI